MFNKLRNTERGQASVLLALAFIVLLGFTALAIDGGHDLFQPPACPEWL